MISIYYTHISEKSHKRLLKDYLSSFSTEFQDKIKRYRRWQDVQLSLLGRALLAKGMEQMNCVFEESDIKHTTFGKPYFKSSTVHFNISHSENIVVCALTNMGDIGIDIEKINTIEVSDFKPQMTANEWQLISESKDAKLSFFDYWTQKEAVIKTHGNGLSIPLESFEIENDKTTIDSDNFFLKNIPLEEDYSCHLALKKSLETIEIKINRINF